MKKVFIGLGLLIIVLFILARISSRDMAKAAKSIPESKSKVETKKASPPTAEEEAMLKNMIETRIVERIDPDLNEAWVNPVQWAGLKYSEKEMVATFLATYCGKKKGTDLNWVDIKDAYSGKKLAKYSESWGFKVY